jgi:hypothetical protein
MTAFLPPVEQRLRVDSQAVSGPKEIKEGADKKTEYGKISFYRCWIVFFGNI